MCKCRVTTWRVDNWISRPRVATRAHTSKSCTYNTFMYISFGEIHKISSYFTGKVTGVRQAICQRNCLMNFGQILLYGQMGGGGREHGGTRESVI